MRKEENEYLTRIGPGTAMGNLLRRFWMPVLLEHEVPGPNEAPLRIRVMGENFLVWRDAQGELGVFEEFCMHRRASLSLARCEGDGLRCIFHGWKFDVRGNVLDTPNLRNPNLAHKVRAPVHPARLGGGLLWVYLGPADQQPDFPDYEFMRRPKDYSCAFRVIWNVNFVQGVESNLDSSHIGILHNNYAFFGERKERESAATRDVVVWNDDRPTIMVKNHTAGFFATAIRDVELNGKPLRYARVHNYIMPFGTFVPAPLLNLHVPIDDENTMSFGIFYARKPIDVEFCRQNLLLHPSIAQTLSPHVQRYLGTPENKWFQDRSVMGSSFSGLHNPISEDLATISSMGPITARDKESTAGSDVAVSRMRTMLINAARALESGAEPEQMSAEQSAVMGCGQGIVAADDRWPEVLAQ
jgi:phenylpropionate dioxygenase-like ring-hydroxylating dioxygenase large terminal subunit